MLELGQTAAPAADLIKDGTEATFVADVVDGSAEVPVIVDFWATWCGPCKTLTPLLEEAVTKAGGKVKLVKIDVDANQRLAAMLAMGQSKPWPDALEAMTGSRQMDASAIIEYYQPLMTWLKDQNKSQTCGW